MSTFYYTIVTAHVLAALVWLGGMFFLGLVGAPVLRRLEPAALRARLFVTLGERFRVVGWAAIATLVATGLANLWLRGILRTEVLTNGEFWASGFGRALGWKLAIVTAMIAISAYHDFVAGPRSGTLEPGSEAAARARRQASVWARVNALLGVALVIVAVRLARGG